VTATPSERVRVNASYARDVRDNRTDSLSYPAVSTDIFLGATPRSNQPFSFWQDRFKVNAEYRAPGHWKASAGIDEDDRERSLQEVVTTRETTLWGRVVAQPRDNVSLALKLAHAQRNHSAYGVATWVNPPENPLLRKYYLADRSRDTAGLRADIGVGDSVNIGLSADYANDDYDHSTIGLTEGRSVSVGADVSVALAEQTQVHFFAQSEQIRSRQAGSQLYAQADWWAKSKDAVDVVGLGVKHSALKGKLDLGADLTYSRSRSDVAVDAGPSSAPFPTATTALDSVKLYATYRLKDNLSLTGSYWYEHYDTKDWRLDGVTPATVSNLLTFGVQPPRYNVNVVRLGVRYRF
jgi:MtrB/PioB family decaheme-associated outer membrane protein